MAPRSPEDRSLTADGFARLLARLDADPARAAIAYERLHRALVRFFDWKGAWSPEDCADETLDRLARRLEAAVAIGSVRGYAHGIARLVLLERRRMPATSRVDAIPDVLMIAEDVAEDDERRFACFERCLASMAAADRDIVTDYYDGERRERILNRRRLAERLGLTDNALRIRVHRFRDKLERCVERCMEDRRRPS